MSSHDALFAEHHTRINALVARFQGHQGVDRPCLLHWLSQFESEHVPLALRILANTNYFTRGNVAVLCRQVVELAVTSMDPVARSRILFVLAGRIWEGNAVVARALRHRDIVSSAQIAEFTSLSRMRRGEWEAVVLLKDFAGTGTQLSKWWRDTGEPLVLPLEAQIIIGVPVLHYRARERLAELGLSVISALDLHEGDDIFHTQSALLSEEERQIVLQYCGRTGASTEFVRGYGQSGLLVAFDHGCPNNSIPLLWHDSDSWSALFRRHA